VSISPIRDDAGRVVGAASIGRAITERKQAERERRALEQQAQQELAARRESEARFQAVWEATSEALALSDPEGIVLAVNPAYCALYGRAPEEIIGHDFAVIFPEAEHAGAMEQYRAVFADPDPPRSYETRVQRPDGTERVVEARADFLVQDGERVAMISAIRDVTDRKRLDQAQQDFVAMAGHDLGSPLTVLRARAQLLQRRQRYDEESIAAILEQTARMDRLIGDLRELAQVEGGGLSMQREDVDLIALAQEAVARARTLATGHAVHLEALERPIVVAGDRGRLGQVLDNLLGNAVKYSPHGGEVRVTVEAVGREACLRVTDHGPGISADALPHLFERFYRGQHAAAEAGLGLGLYISRMLVEAHGGRIWVEAEPGVGSTFSIALPLAARS
jgi:PAS domain S-box-containing protein